MSSHSGDIVHPDITYVLGEELVPKLKEEVKEFTVIDVRDETEFSSGHIKGAENIPSTQFADPANASKILESHLGQKTIVVHCAKSQQRGPACARALQGALDKLVAEKGDELDKSTLPEIKVLRFGYNGFEEKHSGDDVIEK
eukprot:gene23561-28571_t